MMTIEQWHGKRSFPTVELPLERTRVLPARTLYWFCWHVRLGLALPYIPCCQRHSNIQLLPKASCNPHNHFVRIVQLYWPAVSNDWSWLSIGLGRDWSNDEPMFSRYKPNTLCGAWALFDFSVTMTCWQEAYIRDNKITGDNVSASR